MLNSQKVLMSYFLSFQREREFGHKLSAAHLLYLRSQSAVQNP
jgi:hypothetical protein